MSSCFFFPFTLLFLFFSFLKNFSFLFFLLKKKKMINLNVDCLNLIFNELRDKNSLHSCLLVNKEWCNIVVPILWKEYSLHGENSQNEKLFNTILSCLPSSSKQLLFYN